MQIFNTGFMQACIISSCIMIDSKCMKLNVIDDRVEKNF